MIFFKIPASLGADHPSACLLAALQEKALGQQVGNGPRRVPGPGMLPRLVPGLAWLCHLKTFFSLNPFMAPSKVYGRKMDDRLG